MNVSYRLTLNLWYYKLGLMNFTRQLIVGVSYNLRASQLSFTWSKHQVNIDTGGKNLTCKISLPLIKKAGSNDRPLLFPGPNRASIQGRRLSSLRVLGPSHIKNFLYTTFWSKRFCGPQFWEASSRIKWCKLFSVSAGNLNVGYVIPGTRGGEWHIRHKMEHLLSLCESLLLGLEPLNR